jgi:hypothetical protein
MHRFNPITAMSQADAVAHSIDADHLPGQSGGAFEVVFGAGGDFIENDILGGATPEHAADPVQQSGLGKEVLVISGRELFEAWTGR